jgi:hypothetical protein
MKKILLLIVVIGVVLSSCSIEKRRYTGGYSVEWHKSYHPSANYHPHSKEVFPLTASANKEPTVIKSLVVNVPDTVLCDEIIMSNGTLIKGLVVEIGVNEIKYKDCDNISGPTIDLTKSTVFMIRYANGKNYVVTTNHVDNTTTNQTPPANITINNNKSDPPTQKPTYTPTSQSGSGTAIGGVILLILGLLVLVFASIIIGLLIMVLGIILVIV